jgi:hypothetical protein
VGHALVSSALVRLGEDLYLLRCDSFLDELMSTERYPRLTATEAMLNVAGDVVSAGVKVKALLVDAKFTSRLGLRSLKALPLAFVGRFRSNAKVMFEAQHVRVKDLAKRFLPDKARWYPRLRRYIKRLEIGLAEVGVVQLLIIWKAQGYDWHLTTLISTLNAGIQEVFKAWSARWSLEVSHRSAPQAVACLGRRSVPDLRRPPATCRIGQPSFRNDAARTTTNTRLDLEAGAAACCRNLINTLLTEGSRLAA